MAVPPTGSLFDKSGGGALLDRLFAHAARYNLTTPHAAKRLFFSHLNDHEEGLSMAIDALEQLVQQQRLTRVKKTSRRPSERWDFQQSAYVPRGQSLGTNDLARLWFCCLDTDRRHYATHDEIRPLFEVEGEGKPPYHNFFHAVANEDGGAVLYRLYICKATKASAQGQLAKIIGANARGFQPWIEQGSYGVAVLVETPEKAREIEQLLDRQHADRPTFNDRARFIVAVTPTERDYASAVANHEATQWT